MVLFVVKSNDISCNKLCCLNWIFLSNMCLSYQMSLMQIHSCGWFGYPLRSCSYTIIFIFVFIFTSFCLFNSSWIGCYFFILNLINFLVINVLIIKYDFLCYHLFLFIWINLIIFIFFIFNFIVVHFCCLVNQIDYILSNRSLRHCAPCNHLSCI